MTYWLLTTEYPPFYGGGISTYAYFTVKMLTRNGHEVTVFINDSAVGNVSVETADRVRILRFNPAIIGATSYLGHVTNISYAFAQIVKQFIEQEGRPDIIEAQEYLGIAYYLLQYKKLLYDWCRDVPVLITAHSPAFIYLRYNHVPAYRYPEYWIGEMERFCLQAATLVISPSQYLVEAIKKEFTFTNVNVFVIPNPFEQQVENRKLQPTGGEKIIYYGKLSAQKGTFKLLQYFKKLWDEGFNEPLYLYGGDDIVYHPEEKTMGSLVRTHYSRFIHIGKLHLHQKVLPSEMGPQLANAKVIIVPSTIDNLPYVVLEMMALGNIVLISKQGGQAEVVTDGVDGFVFDHEVPETFKAQLFKILMLPPEERNAIRQNAIEKIKSVYNLQKIYAQKIAVIERAKLQSILKTFPFTRSLGVPTSPLNLGGRSLLSIIVPYYNMGTYLNDTMKALMNTMYQNKEIIIVNDGSTDTTSLQQLEQYRHKTGITVLDITNEGLANARNTGALAAKGEYLAFLDADDTVAPDYYTKAIAVLEAYENIHFVGCWTQYFEGSTNMWPTFTPEPPLILYHNTINSSALVYRRSVFLHKGLNDTAMTFGLEDYESVVALASAGYRGIVLPQPLFNYRVRADSMIRSVSKNKKLYLLQYIAEKHKLFYATFAAEIAGLLQANGPGVTIDNPSLDYTVYTKNPFLNKWAANAILFVKKNPRLKKIALALYRRLKS